jgi:hypothetical protein
VGPTFAFASDHFWNVCIAAAIVAFLIGLYGHVIHSRPVIFGAIIAIAVILTYFIISGEMNSGNAGSGVI